MLVIRPDFTVEFANGTSNLAVLVQRLIDAIPEDAPRFKIERLRVREAVVRIGKTVLHLPDLELRNFGDAPGTASTANLLLALFLQILAGGAMEQEEAAFPKSFAGEVKRSAAAIEKVRSR
jgi:hypothetical protein